MKRGYGNNKRGLEFSFVWLFALLAGASILFLAIYGALRTADTERFQADTEIAREISILTDPLQAGFAQGSFGKIEFASETRINNFCTSTGEDFGKNDISVSTRSEIGQEWNLPGGATSIRDKYIFSSGVNTGEEYYIFSKPFNLPYKVADLTILTSGNYCFVDAPEEIKEEILGLRIPNIQMSPNCTLIDPTSVCFGLSGNCEIRVLGTIESGKIEKYGVTLDYTGNLLYAAMFSDKGIYDCNVKRLMQRTAMIAEEFSQKTEYLNLRGCGTNMKPHLDFWYSSTINSDVNNIISLGDQAKAIELENDRELCGVW